MKSLRMFVLMFAVSALPVFLVQAHAQQEIDPDHFDRPVAVKANAQTLKATPNHHASANHHVRTASKHSGRRLGHHQVQAS